MSYSEQVKLDAAKAAQYLREHGWCQWLLQNSIGQCCASGAIGKAVNDNGDAWSHLVDAFVKETGVQIIPTWNDAPGRTKEEVLAVFDKIANS